MERVEPGTGCETGKIIKFANTYDLFTSGSINSKKG